MIEKLRDGLFKVTVYTARDPVTGRYGRQSRRVHGTRAQAKQLEANLLRLRDGGISPISARMTLGSYLEEWSAATASTRQPNTNETYRALTRHIVRALGNVELAKLQPLAIERFYDGLREVLAPRTILDVHRMLSSALRQGVRWRYLERNVCEAIRSPRVQARSVTTLNREQTLTLLAAARGASIEPLVLTAASTGLRKGELLGLRWQDIDFEVNVLHVQQSAQRFTGGFALKSTKTAYSRRSVPLTPQNVAMLKHHRARQSEQKLRLGPAYTDLDLVFAAPSGLPRNPSSVRRQWLRILAKAELGVLGEANFRFHDLRHTHASQLLEQRVPVKVVSERLGHSTPAITLEIYAHSSPNMQAHAIGEFAVWLYGEPVADAEATDRIELASVV